MPKNTNNTFPDNRSTSPYRRTDYWGWESLPAEIKSQILAYVPAADLLNHVTNKSFMKAVIETNERRIADQIIARRTRELRELSASYDYATYDSLFDALKHWISNKAIWVTAFAPLYSYDFLYHFAPGHSKIWYNEVADYVGQILSVHLACHEGIDYQHPDDQAWLIDAARGLSVPSSAMANRTYRPDDIDRIVEGRLAPAPLTWCCDLGSMSRELFPFTPLTDFVWRQAEVSGVLTDDYALIRALGLWPFPVVGRQPYVGRRVGYVCKDEDADMFVELEHQIVDLLIPLKPLQKANLLEKLNIW